MRPALRARRASTAGTVAGGAVQTRKTAPAPASAGSSDSGAVRSPATSSTSGGSAAAAGRRTSARTGWPSRRSSATTARPARPVAPITRTGAVVGAATGAADGDTGAGSCGSATRFARSMVSGWIGAHVSACRCARRGPRWLNRWICMRDRPTRRGGGPADVAAPADPSSGIDGPSGSFRRSRRDTAANRGGRTGSLRWTRRAPDRQPSTETAVRRREPRRPHRIASVDSPSPGSAAIYRDRGFVMRNGGEPRRRIGSRLMRRSRTDGHLPKPLSCGDDAEANRFHRFGRSASCESIYTCRNPMEIPIGSGMTESHLPKNAPQRDDGAAGPA